MYYYGLMLAALASVDPESVGVRCLLWGYNEFQIPGF